MSYWIFIFNRRALENIDPEKITEAVTESNFYTLCRQYHLDPELIPPALENLKVLPAEDAPPLFFLLRYRPEEGCPVRVYRWGTGQEAFMEFLNQAKSEVGVGAGGEQLSNMSQIVGIELRESQLRDLGLLLGYELARWAANSGEGVVRGLDGVWYRLNRQAAFIPLRSE